MPRPKDSQRTQIQQETRIKLLAAATQEFARRGYPRASIDDISQVAGFAKGTIYNYFPSKRELMLALIEAIAAQHLEYMTRQVQAVQDPAEKLERFFTAGFQFVREYYPQAQVLVNNLYGPDDEFKAVMYERYQPMFALVEGILQDGMQAGSFRQLDARQTAALLMNIYLGAASQADADGRTWIEAQQVADFCLYALGSAPPESE